MTLQAMRVLVLEVQPGDRVETSPGAGTFRKVIGSDATHGNVMRRFHYKSGPDDVYRRNHARVTILRKV